MNAPFTLPRHKLTVEDYHTMAKAGILDEDSRVELIEGELIDMAPIGSQHASVVSILTEIAVSQCRGKALVSPQNSLRLSPHDEPQPDLMLLKRRADSYRYALPTAEDVLLLVEIADTTIERDRQIKCPLYARHSIAEFWLVNVAKETLEIYREPETEGYGRMLRCKKSETVSPLLLPDVKIALADLWPD